VASGWWMVAGEKGSRPMRRWSARLRRTRSRASGVASLEAVAAPFILNSRLFAHFVHCSMDARRRTRGSASLPRHARELPPDADQSLSAPSHYLRTQLCDRRIKRACHRSINRCRPESKFQSFISSPVNQRSSLLSGLVQASACSGAMRRYRTS
jgi:hypothetical protein